MLPPYPTRPYFPRGPCVDPCHAYRGAHHHPLASDRAPSPARTRSAAPAAPMDVDTLTSELEGMTNAELASELRALGAPTSGTKAQLARRLAELMVEEVTRWGRYSTTVRSTCV